MKSVELDIEIRNLKKTYREQKALAGVTFDVRKGECFGLLGPNGAGKSTLLKILYGATLPQEGDLFILGLSIASSSREIKARIGVVPQGDGLDTELSVYENLLIFSSYLGLPKRLAEDRIRELLKRVSLDDRADDSVESLSGGMKRRLALVRALLNAPDLLILDEPTVALDPHARNWTWDFLRDLKNQNKTVLLTTHYMEEAEALCDRVALLDHGVLLDIGTPQELIEKHWGPQLLQIEGEVADLSYLANRLKMLGVPYQSFERRILAQSSQEIEKLDLFKQLKGTSVTLRKSNLNDVFLKLMGAELKSGGVE